MKKIKKNKGKTNNNLRKGGEEWYRKEINDAVHKINDIWILDQIYRCIINLTNE